MQHKGPDTKLEGQICLILFKAGVTEPEVDECMDWAFGKNAWYAAPADWVDPWNKLHPQHAVKPKDSFVEFMFVVGFLWVAYERMKLDQRAVFQLLDEYGRKKRAEIASGGRINLN